MKSNQFITLLGGVRPSWVQPGAIFDEDFANQRAWPRPFAQEMADTRASQQYVPNGNGLLVPIASTVLPISDTYLEVEPSATNLLTFNQAIDNAAWGSGSGNPTVSADATTAPDGTTTADKVIAGTTNGSQQRSQNITFTAASYAISFYAKPAGYTQAFVRVGGTINSNTIFDVSAGSVVSAGAATASIVASYNGWYRCNAILTGQAITTGIGVGPASGGAISFAGDGTSGVYIWEPNGVQASAVTSTITTAGAAATRATNAITLQRTGVGRVVFTFDDNSQQTISGINTAAQYTIPTNLNRPLIKRMTGYAA